MAGKIAFTFLIAASLLGANLGQAQNRCSTIEYEMLRHSPKSKRESKDQFEEWMQNKLSQARFKAFRTASATFTIPVVVHVIHNGTGDPTYISNAQILSQIDVLNRDFKRLNPDAGNTPSEFTPVAGNMDIEFVLAKQDPDGLATNGITYTQGTKSQWALSDQSEFKALSYWPAENYLNIWVIKFASQSNIGFAQLPVSNTLPGLEEASTDRLTDGIVSDYRAFGSADAGPFPLFPQFNKGRTATHEIGHFFGLRHIWGDASGCATDYVADTPPQAGATSFCPTYPQISCSGSKMFMNYMDYSDDGCMNIFTMGQVARMLIVLADSPRRASLTTSPGATDPLPVASDLGIRSIMAPGTSSCVNPVVPEIEVRNYGSNTITSAQIQLLVNSVVAETITFPMTLNPNAVSLLLFPSFNLSSGASQISFKVLQTNGGIDGNPTNDQLSQTVSVPLMTSLPVVESFDTTPASWAISNPDGQITWANTVAPDNSPTNRAMIMEFIDYQNEGTLDWLLTPAFSISNLPEAQVRFDVAYAQFPGQSGDALRIYALPGCNTDLSQAILLYDKSGSALATAATSSNAFTPIDASEWRKPEILSLSSLPAATTWQLAFVARNGYGNNLYLDNVIIAEEEVLDIVLSGIASPGIVHCSSLPVVSFYVSNHGTFPVDRFHAEYSINGSSPVSKEFTNIQIATGEQKSFEFNPIELQDGPNEIIISISNPNGTPDFPANNTLVFNTIVDKSLDKPPLRMTFDNPAETPWQIASPVSSQNWEPITTSKEKSITYRSYSNTNLGDESWLVSPVMDFSENNYSLFFEVSYARNIPADDRLVVIASKDCGITYTQVIMDLPASAFSSFNSSVEWFPGTDADWRKQYLSLEGLAGEKNIRIAIVAHNNNGNNIFIDNIEFFAGDDPGPPVTTVPYQLYYSAKNTLSDLAITFNLLQKQDVRVQIFSMQGNLVSDTVLPETLNQTYYYDFSNQATGIYLFRLQVNNQLSSTKVFISH